VVEIFRAHCAVVRSRDDKNAFILVVAQEPDLVARELPFEITEDCLYPQVEISPLGLPGREAGVGDHLTLARPGEIPGIDIRMLKDDALLCGSRRIDQHN